MFIVTTVVAVTLWLPLHGPPHALQHERDERDESAMKSFAVYSEPFDLKYGQVTGHLGADHAAHAHRRTSERGTLTARGQWPSAATRAPSCA